MLHPLRIFSRMTKFANFKKKFSCDERRKTNDSRQNNKKKTVTKSKGCLATIARLFLTVAIACNRKAKEVIRRLEIQQKAERAV